MRRALLLAALLGWGGICCAEPVLIGTFGWTEQDEAFGGLSGLDIADDGHGFVAIGDRGFVVSGTFIRVANLITDVTAGSIQPLLDSDSVDARFPANDSEGLALASDGTLYISFERTNRVDAYPDPAGPALPLPRHRAFTRMQDNAGLEALAIGPDGALYTLPERSGRADRPFPVFRFWDGEWEVAFELPRRGAFLPVGADIGPDGLFYLLERDYSAFGFRTRVRRFDLDGGQEEALLETPTGRHGNLEGIGVWRGGDGDIRLTMISDNNFRALSRTQVVEYRLTPTTAQR